ncbi:hypothetical protein RCH18_001939 [Flavobacterium sp. PL11]|jgi:hypothetical protein|uniref:DUF4252 domain-containing protein n=1 Tax=Flavobacterium sp. PL11 TaxID=3071717 RepID=UPI002DFFC318|nr:hypothetical protein [Flavobacterium sp. PL11]
MRVIFKSALFLCLFIVSCNSKPSLQKYFVENTENKNFTVLDLSTEILKVDKTKLSVAQSAAIESFEKINILTFKATETNKAQFETERAKLELLLEDKQYQQLMKFSSGTQGASISFVGTDENIEEFIVYANKKENGFAVIRILGKEMSPTNLVNMISVMRKANMDMQQFKPLQELMK